MDVEKKSLILCSKISCKELLEDIIEKKINLSYNEILEVLEILYEMEYVKEINIENLIHNFLKKSINENKKQNGKKFVAYLRQERFPIMTKRLKEIKNIVKKLKLKGIQVLYPQNLEGSGISLKVDIKNKSKCNEIIKNIVGLEKDLKRILDIL